MCVYVCMYVCMYVCNECVVERNMDDGAFLAFDFVLLYCIVLCCVVLCCVVLGWW